MEWLNFRHLYSFWMVWKHGGFRRASEKMRVSQSAISDQVAQLEDYLGKSLFIRSPRKVELTGAGSLLLVYADSIFYKAQEINQVIRDDTHSFFPASINIGIVGEISRNFVSQFINSVQKKYQEAFFKVSTGSSEELIKRLKNHDLHAVFSIDPPSRESTDIIHSRKILSSPICIAGSKDIIRSIKKRELKKIVPFYEFSFPYLEDINKTLKELFSFTPRTLVRSDDIPLIRFLTNSTGGLALIPKIGVVDDTKRDQLDTVVIKKLGVVDIFAYSSATGHYRTLADQLFASFINEQSGTKNTKDFCQR